ncbi:MAG: hypothetical protein WEE89_06650 [Gemmatimonadota bacterium]
MVPLLLALTFGVQAPQAVDTSGVYQDARARDLHVHARERRRAIDRSITSYQAVVKERMSAGLRTRLRDRLLYRRETASRIDWRRGGPINITAMGAREAVPIITTKPGVPKDLENFLPRLAFDPMDTDALLSVDTTALKHPLGPGAEAHYRFSTGDSMSVNLGERTIKLVELKVHPRRSDFHLITGSFWIDSDSYSLVQTTFRLANDIDFNAQANPREVKSRTIGFLRIGTDSGGTRNVSFTPARAELHYITIEYSLVHLRWWMPRLFAAEGTFQMGPVKTPIHYERSYTDYQVSGDTTIMVAARESLPDSVQRICRPRTEFSVSVDVGEDSVSTEERARRAVRDSVRRREQEQIQAKDTARARRLRERAEALARDTARARRIREREECSKLYHVTVEDSAALLTSAALPTTIYGDQVQLTSDPELARLMDRLKKLANPPWQAKAASFAWGLRGNGLVRYNKIEALSIGARSDFDFGRMRADVTGRIGVADLEPNLELGLSRGTLNTQIRLAGYRRLDVMDKPSGFGGLSTSLGAFFVGRDERDYYRTLGGELVARPADTHSQWYTLRLFGETQRPVSNETDFSIPNLFDNSHLFDANLRANRAHQFGGALTLRRSWGQNPAGFRFATEAFVEGAGGTYDYLRESLMLQLGLPLPFKLAGAVEVAGGTSQFPLGRTLDTDSAAPFDFRPVQSSWFLGGVRSIRGYEIGADLGSAFWRARGEIGTALPAARLVLFSDFGWAGSKDNISRRASLWSVGVGGSFLDGILRVDLAHALRGSRAWKLHVSVDGIL